MLNVLLVAAGVFLMVLGFLPMIIEKFRGDETERKRKIIIVPIIIGMVVVIVALSVRVIPTNHTGVKVTFSQVDENPVNSGFELVIPFAQEIKQVDNRLTKVTLDEKCYSETISQTIIYYENIEVTYQIPSESSVWIYSNVPNYKKELINGQILSSAIKASSVKFKDEEATNRGLIEPEIVVQLQKACDERYGENRVRIVSAVVGNVDFTEEYNEALQAKNLANLAIQTQTAENQKAKEKAENEREIAKIQAEAEAEQKKIQAEAEAEQQKIQAEAEAESVYILAQKQAAANKLLAQSLSDDILRQKFYEVWDGKLPQYVGGENGSFIFNMLEDEETIESETTAETETETEAVIESESVISK